MAAFQSNDPLHGVTLAMIMDQLTAHFTWEELARAVPINCFKSNPSIKSSLNFLRKTPWARTAVEEFYIKSLHNGFDKAQSLPKTLYKPKR
jgi:uncharacterized protein (DUF2132 family)